jgi:quercetin 2,3-dioxygenase
LTCCLPASASVQRAVAMAVINVVPHERLFVSEPPPQYFGNAPNPKAETAEGWTHQNWLKSRFHFSFAEYSDGPSNFGVLRVMNDDLVQPDRGFGEHPHRDMEIITFVVEGDLTHKDSMGTQETLSRGSIQFMTAGTGVRHSEHNLRKDAPLRFIQSWVTPRSRGLRPNYGSMIGDDTAATARKNQWAHLVSDVTGSVKTPVQINQDCNVFVLELTPGSKAPIFNLGESRQAYLLCVEGSAQLDATAMRQHDGAEIKGPLTFEASTGPRDQALLLLFEMAKTRDSRGTR